MTLALWLMTEPFTMPHTVNPQEVINAFSNTKCRMKYDSCKWLKKECFILLPFLGKRVSSIVTDTDYCPQNWFSLISKYLLCESLIKVDYISKFSL